MNIKEAKILMPVIQAFAEGKTIQYYDSLIDIADWEDCENPNFENLTYKFRIKPETTYRPFKDAEECWQEMQKHQPFGYTYDRFNGIRDCITKVATAGVSYDSPTVISFEEVFDKFVFADGVPFGIKVE